MFVIVHLMLIYLSIIYISINKTSSPIIACKKSQQFLDPIITELHLQAI